MINIEHLSHSALFSQVQHVIWAEGHEDEWASIHPIQESFSSSELLNLFPNSVDIDEDSMRSKLQRIINSEQERFEPTENYYFDLFDLAYDLSEAQTILYKADSPCIIVEYVGLPVLTCCGDVWCMSNLIAKAFLLLGYIPPFILQEPYILALDGQNTTDRCKHYIARQLNCLEYEKATLLDRVS